MTVGGELDMDTSGDALQNKALNLTFQNIAFSASGIVLIRGPENSNIMFNRDTFVDGNSNAAAVTQPRRAILSSVQDGHTNDPNGRDD